MKFLVFLPFLVQGVVMAIDEFYFHRRRGLPLWERLGHPLDTLTVLICYVWLLMRPLQSSSVMNWAVWVVFSCLCVTKDEWVHHRHCSAVEVWLHSLLFVLHPICFLAAGWMAWMGGYNGFIRMQTGLLILFMVYQFTYWNLMGKHKNEVKYGASSSVRSSNH